MVKFAGHSANHMFKYAKCGNSKKYRMDLSDFWGAQRHALPLENTGQVHLICIMHNMGPLRYYFKEKTLDKRGTSSCLTIWKWPHIILILDDIVLLCAGFKSEQLSAPLSSLPLSAGERHFLPATILMKGRGNGTEINCFGHTLKNTRSAHCCLADMHTRNAHTDRRRCAMV